ncbi:hypothetical protein GCM10022251_20960 [Phytohabitans flavus]
MEILPVSSAPSEWARETAAPRSGWWAAPSPAERGSPAAIRPEGQKRCRWNGYVGRSTRRAPTASNAGAQSTPMPFTYSRPSAASSVVSSGRSSRMTRTPSPASAASTPSGPISRKTEPSSVATASAKRTVSRTCLTQYSGSVTSPAATTGMTGSANDSEVTTARKSSSIGAINGEWNACDTRNRVRFSNREATANTAASSPATTTFKGPLTAAIDTPSVSSGSTSDSAARNATIAPPAGNACISEARAETNVQASERDSTPATCAAAISPMEWPATWSGRRPKEAASLYSATSTANSAGCAHPVWSSSSASVPHITSRTPGSSCASTSSSADVNTGYRS